MKSLALLTLIAVLPLQTFAAGFRGIDKNIVVSCYAPGKKVAVYVMSENYTTTGRAGEGSPSKLMNHPGAMATIVADPERNLVDYNPFAHIYEPAMPLTQVEKSSMMDKTLGVYINQNYRLDIKGRKDSDIELQNLNDGTRYTCRAVGDCC